MINDAPGDVRAACSVGSFKSHQKALARCYINTLLTYFLCSDSVSCFALTSPCLSVSPSLYPSLPLSSSLYASFLQSLTLWPHLSVYIPLQNIPSSNGGGQSSLAWACLTPPFSSQTHSHRKGAAPSFVPSTHIWAIKQHRHGNRRNPVWMP